ncbi:MULTISPECIES: NAD(P)/FAD-dependent oxidoreductase [unclassified Roseovarius]|uniref:NAD(P)/FAD-dependent oxidoreductase n=1 Tax=unclassified Roseovarius TaxID=2614913 RepID=UPI00273E53C3|nr:MULTISPECIES: FAD-dependent oxidoreductase [unclassified Roseovarius]
MASRQKLLVVGGGYVGCDVARRLDRVMDVTLVEPKPAFLHAPAMIRALVEPDLLAAATIPYDGLLREGRVVRGRVAALHSEGATLEDGTEISSDFTLVATGSSYNLPFKSSAEDLEVFLDAHRTLAERIAQARHIAIVGAGPVGTELAGEIATARPDAHVTLIAAAPLPMPDQPARLGRALMNRLHRLGVKVITHRSAPGIAAGMDAQDVPLGLSDGQDVAADLVLPALGAMPCTDLLSALPSVRLDSAGRVMTDPYLRPAPGALPGLFTGGDMAATGDAMTIVGILRQGPYLSKILRAAAGGKRVDVLTPYRPWRDAPMLVPVGPRLGASHLPLPGPLALAGTMRCPGDRLTRLAKGRDLFVGKYRRQLGAQRLKGSRG